MCVGGYMYEYVWLVCLSIICLSSLLSSTVCKLKQIYLDYTVYLNILDLMIKIKQIYLDEISEQCEAFQKVSMNKASLLKTLRHCEAPMFSRRSPLHVFIRSAALLAALEVLLCKHLVVQHNWEKALKQPHWAAAALPLQEEHYAYTNMLCEVERPFECFL